MKVKTQSKLIRWYRLIMTTIAIELCMHATQSYAQAESPSTADVLPSCVDVTVAEDNADIRMSCKFGVGRREGTTESAGTLTLLRREATTDMSSPESLEPFVDSSVMLIRGIDGKLRQVLSSQYLLDIVTSNQFTYSINYYLLSDIVGPQSNGCYSGVGTAVKTCIVQNPDLSTNNISRLVIKCLAGGATDNYECVYQAWNNNSNQWLLVKGGGVSSEIVNRSTQLNSGVTNVVIARTAVDEYQQVCSRVLNFWQPLSFGFALVKTTEDPDGANLSRCFSYYADAAASGSVGQVSLVVEPNGSWKRFEYDTDGRMVRVITPWKDAFTNAPAEMSYITSYSYAPVDYRDDGSAEKMTPRITVEAVGSAVVRKTYWAIFTNQFERVRISERCLTPQALYGDTNNLRECTIVHACGSINGVELTGRTKSIELSDGTVQTYSYERGTYTRGSGAPQEATFISGMGSDLCSIVTKGTKTNASGVAFKSTQVRRVTNLAGNEVLFEEYVYTGVGFERIKWTVSEYDDNNAMVAQWFSDNRATFCTWSGSAICSVSNEAGEVTYLWRDGLKRVIRRTVPGVTGVIPEKLQTFQYDALGKVLVESTKIGAFVSVTTNRFDLAGRLESTRTDGRSLLTRYEDEGRTVVIVRGDGVATTNAVYRDNRPKAALPGPDGTDLYFDYFPVSSNMTLVSETRYAATNSPRWARTTQDGAGRLVCEERSWEPGGSVSERSCYDNKGRLIRVETHGLGAHHLVEYDELGQRTLSGWDVDGDGVLRGVSRDQMEGYDERIVEIDGDWWREFSTYNWLSVSNDVVTTNRIRRERLTGLASNVISEAISYDNAGKRTSVCILVNATNRIRTERTTESDSSNIASQVTCLGMQIQASTKVGSATSYAYEYDESGFVIATRDTTKGLTRTHYGRQGNPDWSEDAQSNRTTFVYDKESGKLIEKRDPASAVVCYRYDSRGNLTQMWGSGTYPTKWSYDAYGKRIATTTYQSGSAWEGGVWPTNSEGSAETTSNIYVAASGKLLATIGPDGRDVVRFKYSESGYEVGRHTGRKQGTNDLWIVHEFDSTTGQRTAIKYSDGTPSVFFTYDREGRIQTIRDAVGEHTVSYAGFQAVSESVTGMYNIAVSHLYDTNGVSRRLSGIVMGSGYSALYDYDDVGRIEEIVVSSSGFGSRAFRYAYVSNSSVIASVSDASGWIQAARAYDSAGMLTQMENRVGSTLVSKYSYVYDEMRLRTVGVTAGSAFGAATNACFHWEKNSRRELTGSTRYFSSNLYDTNSPDVSSIRRYSYDNVGNRTLSVSGSNAPINYSANLLNQYRTIGSATNTFDADGNVVCDGQVAYTWDGENRLSSVTPVTPVVGAQSVAVCYDYLGRMARRTCSTFDTGVWRESSTNLYIYDGWNLICEITFDEAGCSTNMYFWGLDSKGVLQTAGANGALLHTTRRGSSGVRSYAYLYDGSENVCQLVDLADFSVVAHYEYDPYGNETMCVGAAALENKFRFSTKMWDGVANAYCFGLRFYSPKNGRWLNRDPMFNNPAIVMGLPRENVLSLLITDSNGLKPVDVSGRNYYAFVQNQPLDRYDAMGLWCQAYRPWQFKFAALPFKKFTIGIPGAKCKLKFPEIDVRMEIRECGQCCKKPCRCADLWQGALQARASFGGECEAPITFPPIIPPGLLKVKIGLYFDVALRGTANMGGCTPDKCPLDLCLIAGLRLSAKVCAGLLGADVCCGVEGGGNYRWCTCQENRGCLWARVMCEACWEMFWSDSKFCKTLVIWDSGSSGCGGAQ